MMLTARFEEALILAVRLHAGQTRKGTDTPYISHLLAVTGIVLEHGAGEDEAIAALLHDAAEDAGGRDTLEQIRDRFGENVADIVAGCTDSWTIPRPPWRGRKSCRQKKRRITGHWSICKLMDMTRTVLASLRWVRRAWGAVLTLMRAQTSPLTRFNSEMEDRKTPLTVSSFMAAGACR